MVAYFSAPALCQRRGVKSRLESCLGIMVGSAHVPSTSNQERGEKRTEGDGDVCMPVDRGDEARGNRKGI